MLSGGGEGFVILCAHKKKTTCTQCLQLHLYESQLFYMPLAVYKTLELFRGGGGGGVKIPVPHSPSL